MARGKKAAQARAQTRNEYGQFSPASKSVVPCRRGAVAARSCGGGDSSSSDYILVGSDWVRIQSLGKHGGASSSRARGPSCSCAKGPSSTKRLRAAVVTPPTKMKKNKFAAMNTPQKLDFLLDKVKFLEDKVKFLTEQIDAMSAKVYKK